MSKKHCLYIGIHGYAGSGKDTVTKMIRTILSRMWSSLDDCKEYYKKIYTDPTISATYELQEDMLANNVYCIAFADQLKSICSAIFGIPTGRFYMNKNTAWVCINKNFKYTEIRPIGANDKIVTAEDYYDNYSAYSSDTNISYYMSLRELLVYVGTYVLQHNINQNIFVNVVNNIINTQIRSHDELDYIICTDVRFMHEYQFIRSKNGIIIDVTRNNVEQLDNVAEHDLDDFNNYDFVIDNSGTYDDLFEQVWDMIHCNVVFSNVTCELDVHENVNNYIRLIGSIRDGNNGKWQLCVEHGIQNIQYDSGKIYMLSPIGGPIIKLYSQLDCSDSKYNIVVNNIEYDIMTNTYILS